jgi:hypothetical protein
MMQVWRNRQVLSEQTSDSTAFLNAACLLTVNNLINEALLYKICIPQEYY